MNSVYTFGPTFRAEKSHTKRHLSEFYMVEAETTLLETGNDLVVIMNLKGNWQASGPKETCVCYAEKKTILYQNIVLSPSQI